jgi:Resolvase, N terminal domain
MVTLDLYQWKVRLISVTDKNPFVEFQRGMLALLAQLERRIIVARVNAGIAEAKRQGKHYGHPKKVFRRDEAMRMRAEGRSHTPDRGHARRFLPCLYSAQLLPPNRHPDLDQKGSCRMPFFASFKRT